MAEKTTWTEPKSVCCGWPCRHERFEKRLQFGSQVQGRIFLLEEVVKINLPHNCDWMMWQSGAMQLSRSASADRQIECAEGLIWGRTVARNFGVEVG